MEHNRREAPPATVVRPPIRREVQGQSLARHKPELLVQSWIYRSMSIACRGHPKSGSPAEAARATLIHKPERRVVIPSARKIPGGDLGSSGESQLA
jgi:hypothetical protein